jgi:hypothetical protein
VSALALAPILAAFETILISRSIFMIEPISRFIGRAADSELARTARRSALTIWNAHLSALVTTRDEAGKFLAAAIAEGQRLGRRARPAAATRRPARRPVRRTARRAA